MDTCEAPGGLERRGAERFRVYANLRVIWPDALTACQARLVNLSDSGAAVAPDRPLTYGARVYVEILRFHLWATAHVRRCAAPSSGYFAALEFDGPLHWNLPTGS